MKTPMIIKECSRGYDCYSIIDDMLIDRRINCCDEINEETVNSMIQQLLYLEKQDPHGEITIYINSPGGSVIDGLALYDVMQALSCPIRTICMGMAASMASILFISGDKRCMLPHSKIMIHDPLIRSTGGSALALKTVSENLMSTRQITAEILAKHSRQTVKQILAKTATDTYKTTEKAIALGMADEIISAI